MDISKSSISQIKEIIDTYSIKGYPQLISLLRKDTRKGVQNLSLKLQRLYDNRQIERDRIKGLKNYEYNLTGKRNLVAGMDEVGRGPLAGPVVSCAVVLPKESEILYINDSKKISATMRQNLYQTIMNESISIGIGIIHPNIIDDINIYQSTKESMRKAVQHLEINPDVILIDAMTIEKLPIPQISVVKGDEKCYSIAAASIIAKVTRDSMMEAYHKEYPQYNFLSNKGYGTQEHIEAIKKYGICPIHRMSFLGNLLVEQKI